MAQDNPLGRRANPVAHIELWLVALGSHPAHKDGVALCPQTVRDHLGHGVGYHRGLVVVVEEAISSLRPLQDDVGTMMGVHSDKTAVEPTTFALEHTHSDLDTGVAETLDATSAHTGERVDAAHHNALDALGHDEVGAGRSTAVMGAWLQADIECGAAEEPFVFGLDRCKAVDFGMALAATHVVTFADDAVVGHEHRAHHGVRLGVLLSTRCQLQTAFHVSFVYIQCCHHCLIYASISLPPSCHACP